MDEDAAREAFRTALAGYAQDFETFFLARLLSLEFSYTDEVCKIRFPVRDFLFNPQGTLHGGVIACVMDISMGHLIKKSLGASGATLEMKLQYLAPLREPEARCEGRFLRKGKSICFLESRLWNHEGELAAVASSTWRVLRQKEAGA